MALRAGHGTPVSIKSGWMFPAAEVPTKVSKPIGIKGSLMPMRKITFSSSLSLSFLSSSP
jgi:hypothetical protein